MKIWHDVVTEKPDSRKVLLVALDEDGATCAFTAWWDGEKWAARDMRYAYVPGIIDTVMYGGPWPVDTFDYTPLKWAYIDEIEALP